MKTPTAIFFGLALIAAAIFFREPSINPAHAQIGSGCGDTEENACYIRSKLKGLNVWVLGNSNLDPL